MALYAALRDAGEFQVRRADMKQGEVKAEPMDFCIDVEVKARRALGADTTYTPDNPIVPDYYAIGEWIAVLTAPATYAQVSIKTRELLGLVFEKARLGIDGDYRTLFFRVKNQQGV